MPLHFHPAILRDDVPFTLPGPITQVRIQDAWDSDQYKIPLVAGDLLAGHSQSGVEITLQGQVGRHEGTLTLTEADMLATLLSLREALRVDPTHPRYQLQLYLDEAVGTRRAFHQCSTTRFDWDLSDPALYTFSTTIHAEDPVLYEE